MLIGVRQPPWVPAFTKEGFRQDDIPEHLMGIVKIARMKSETFIEPCIADVAALNCQVMLNHSSRKKSLFFRNYLKLKVKMNVK